MPLFEELGLGEPLGREGFLPKYAAEFLLADGSTKRRYRFSDALEAGPDRALEVERARFDEILLSHAEASGAVVHRGTVVKSFEIEPDGVLISTLGQDGTPSRVEARVLVDASGQASLVASRMKLRRMNDQLRNFCLYAHFRGAARVQGDAEGDISIVLSEAGWWWVIPLRNDITSLGYVAPASSLKGKKADGAFFDTEFARSSYLTERFSEAQRTTEVHAVSGYSYSIERLTGDRWLLIGDAAGFLDPVFSTGVYLGVRSAVRAAEAIDRALAKGSWSRREFRDFERSLAHTYRVYREYVEDFYRPEFREVLMHPTDRLQLRQAVTSLLAGRFDESGVRWRASLVRRIAKANLSMKLTPRLFGRG
jgi:flavin-dependent dehydrogenase